MSGKKTIDSSYLEHRRSEIDYTEYMDIYINLVRNGASKSDRIVEWCSGEGGLIDYLKLKGYRNVIGCDILARDIGRGDVVFCDLNRDNPPRGDVVVFQHCIEHLDQGRVVELLRWSLDNYRFVIGVVPGHHSDDPTHVVNHYEYADVVNIVKKVGARFYDVAPDSASYIHPENTDYIVVLSNVQEVKVYRSRSFRLLYRVFAHVFRRSYYYSVISDIKNTWSFYWRFLKSLSRW